MQYEAEISREHPTCFLFVIDQSGSMDEMTEAGRSKANFVADVLNKTSLYARHHLLQGRRGAQLF